MSCKSHKMDMLDTLAREYPSDLSEKSINSTFASFRDPKDTCSSVTAKNGILEMGKSEFFTHVTAWLDKSPAVTSVTVHNEFIDMEKCEFFTLVTTWLDKLPNVLSVPKTCEITQQKNEPMMVTCLVTSAHLQLIEKMGTVEMLNDCQNFKWRTWFPEILIFLWHSTHLGILDVSVYGSDIRQLFQTLPRPIDPG